MHAALLVMCLRFLECPARMFPPHRHQLAGWTHVKLITRTVRRLILGIQVNSLHRYCWSVQ